MLHNQLKSNKSRIYINVFLLKETAVLLFLASLHTKSKQIQSLKIKLFYQIESCCRNINQK